MGVGDRRHSLELADFLSACLGHPVCLSLAPGSLSGPSPLLSLSQQLSLSCPLACLSPSPQSPPSLPAWVAAMGRKRLITDSYPAVKRREGPVGHSKGELAPELGLLLWGGGSSGGAEGHERTWADVGNGRGSEVRRLLPTPGLAVAGRGKGVARAGEQWGRWEVRGRGLA